MRLSTLRALNEAARRRRAAVLVTDLEAGAERLVGEADVAADAHAGEIAPRLKSGRSGLAEDGRTFFTVSLPPPRLVVIGAVHISQSLAPLAAVAGFDMTVIDPRTAFATAERFPSVPVIAEWPVEVLPRVALDRYTALVALTHDPKIDDEPIAAALRAGCFYVGALGSRKTHGRRVERLAALGSSPDDLSRIRAPIGLDIGAQSPAEIAVAILAEIVQALRRGPEPEHAVGPRRELHPEPHSEPRAA